MGGKRTRQRSTGNLKALKVRVADEQTKITQNMSEVQRDTSNGHIENMTVEEQAAFDVLLARTAATAAKKNAK